MKGRAARLVLTCLICTLLFISCDTDDNDNPAEVTSTFSSLDGTWKFTLTPPDTVTGEPFETEGVYLYEHEGAVTGYSSVFFFQGTRVGNQITMNVIRSMDDVSEVESSLNLTLTGDSALTGAGTYIKPAIDPMRLDDETLHPKFTTLHDDWDGGYGASYFYDVAGERMAEAPAEASVIRKAGELRLASVPWCSVIWDTDSFLLRNLTGNTIRQFGICELIQDGGGYYLDGRDGPGHIDPLWTSTIYYPIEWCWSGTRSYNFTMSIQGTVTGLDIEGWINDNWDSSAESTYHMTKEECYQGLESFYQNYGGFAIATGYSTRTQNTSIYLMTATGQSESVFRSDPFTSKFVNAIVADCPHDPWFFTGGSVHDSFTLQRDPTGISSTPMLFTYFVGSNIVHFD